MEEETSLRFEGGHSGTIRSEQPITSNQVNHHLVERIDLRLEGQEVAIELAHPHCRRYDPKCLKTSFCSW